MPGLVLLLSILVVDVRGEGAAAKGEQDLRARGGVAADPARAAKRGARARPNIIMKMVVVDRSSIA